MRLYSLFAFTSLFLIVVRTLYAAMILSLCVDFISFFYCLQKSLYSSG